MPHQLPNDDLRFLIEDIEPSTIIVEKGSLDTVLPFTGRDIVKTMDDYNIDSVKIYHLSIMTGRACYFIHQALQGNQKVSS